MVLVWTGYGALQLKFIAKENGNFNEMLYNFASLGLCFVIIVLSLLWIAMAKGSKFVQEAHEAHIAKYIEKCEKIGYLFCNLGKYCNGDYDTDRNNVKDKVSIKNPLKAYRYSPSKINIALGWVSAVVASALGVIHAITSMNQYIIILALCVTLVIMLLGDYFMECLKGGKIYKKGEIKNG